jgi:ribonucleoside-diphosphate reductase alpha chain
LIDYLQKEMEIPAEGESPSGNGFKPVDLSPKEGPLEQGFLKIGDLCPECGEAAVVNEEGCRKCYACGFSEC